jgi:hypothetical protein
MNGLYQSITDATINALGELYGKEDLIEIKGGKVNGEAIPGDAYAALAERIRINANLSGESFKPGATSQILLQVWGRKREYDVMVGPDHAIELRLRK